MQSRRVVITGMGAVTSIGIGIRAFSESLQAGRSGISKFRSSNVLGFPCEYGGEVPEFDPQQWVRKLDPDKIGRCSQFAIAAARQAIDDARIEPSLLTERGCCVSVGTTDGESQAMDYLVGHLLERGARNLDAGMVSKVPADRLSATVAQEFGLTGEVMTISTACSAGNYAIGNAFDLIRSGEADFAIGGGAESIARKSLAGFYRLGAIAPDRCRPFDAHRKGLIPGEAGAMLFMESLESAQARGARIYAEVLGYGLSCDAKHATSPDQASIVVCMKRSHASAGISPKDVDYVCAHGTGTAVNDTMEAKAIREVFGDHTPPTSSIKSMVGHTMGAASALGAVASVLAIHEGFLPPTINFETSDPECPIDCVPNQARSARPRIVQNNGFAFGGNNAVLILSALASA